MLGSSYQGVKRSLNFAYDTTAGDDQVSVDSYQKYLLLKVKNENHNIEIDGRNFHDQPNNNSIKQYHVVRKVSTGQGDDYWILLILKKNTD